MRAMMIGATLSLLVGGNAFAAGPSKCDSGITKAAGKKVACKASVTASAQKKGTTPVERPHAQGPSVFIPYP